MVFRWFNLLLVLQSVQINLCKIKTIHVFMPNQMRASPQRGRLILSMSSFSLSAGWNEFNASTPAQDLAWSEDQVSKFHLLGTIQCNLKHPAGLENPIYGAQKDSPGNKNSMYLCLKSNLVILQHLRVKSKLGYLWPSSPDSNKTTVLENIQAGVMDPSFILDVVNHLQVWY